MKFGCCSNMVAKGNDNTGIELAEQIKDLGYDYIELPFAGITALSDADFENTKRRLMKSGLPCYNFNFFAPADLKLTGPHVDMNQIKAYTKKGLRRMEELGTKFVGIGSGPARSFPDGFSRDIAWQQLIEFFHFIGTSAEEHGITALIEPLRSTECNLIRTTAEGVAMAKEVNRKNVGMVVDYFHFVNNKDKIQSLEEAKDFIMHAHIARAEGRGFPKSAEEEDYLTFINTLKKIGYNGNLSIEAVSKDFSKDAAAGLSFMKNSFKL